MRPKNPPAEMTARTRPSLARRLGRVLWQLLMVMTLAPAAIILIFRWVDPPSSSVIIQARAAALIDGRGWGSIHQQWVDLPQIAPALQLAVIAAEDQRFPDHWGFDVDAIADALETRARGGRLRGASTISQQVAKNLFLSHDRSWVRKGIEAYLTGWIELLWPKRRILEVYLNIAQFSERDYGAAAAAQALFQTHPARLTERQSALLAAALPAPEDRNATRPSQYLVHRATWIRNQMRQLGYAYLDRL